MRRVGPDCIGRNGRQAHQRRPFSAVSMQDVGRQRFDPACDAAQGAHIGETELRA